MTIPSIKSAVGTFLADEGGATMVEYGIMVALIAAVCIVIITSMGTKVSAEYNAVESAPW